MASAAPTLKLFNCCPKRVYIAMANAAAVKARLRQQRKAQLTRFLLRRRDEHRFVNKIKYLPAPGVASGAVADDSPSSLSAVTGCHCSGFAPIPGIGATVGTVDSPHRGRRTFHCRTLGAAARSTGRIAAATTHDSASTCSLAAGLMGIAPCALRRYTPRPPR